MPAEDAPASGSTRVLSVDITPERADDVTEALRELVGRIPDHPAIQPLLDAGVADGHPFVVTPPVTGQTLDEALRVYGPAAIEDALPRLRQLAAALDLAADHAVWHGALEPQDIIVSADQTRMTGVGIGPTLARLGVAPQVGSRYAAPETAHESGGLPASDQFSLALIAHEWMFGLPQDPLDGFVSVPSLPGIDAASMQRAFDIATDRDPSARFASCVSFVAALERSVDRAAMLAGALATLPSESPGASAVAVDLPLAEPEAEPALQAPPLLPAPAPEPSGSLSRAGLVGALLVGVAIGALAMRTWMGPSDRSSSPPESSGPLDAPLADPAIDDRSTAVIDTPVTPPRDDVAPARSDAVPARHGDAGLLVHSTPAGATVSIDGVVHGTTPVAIRGLELGTRAVVIRQAGYRAAERQVTLTPERPSRTLEVDLARVPRAIPASQAASAVRRAAPTATLVVDSRPSGASVVIDGKPAGTTPLTLTGLSPGRRTVRIEQPGYKPVTTTVNVEAGQRARVAARLEGGSDKE